MRHSYLCFALATSLLGAGEYSAFSPGFEFSFSKGMSSHQNSSNMADKDTQWIDADKLVGIAITGQIRLGDLLSGELSSLAVIPAIGLRFGDSRQHASSPNMAYFYTDGYVEKVSDAKLNNKTKLSELTLSLALRWYFMTNNTAYGGAFIECGPLACRTQHKSSLRVTGTDLFQPLVDTRAKHCTNTSHGLMVGIGKSNIYDGHQFTYGLSLHAMRAKGDKRLQSKVNLHTSWTF